MYVLLAFAPIAAYLWVPRASRKFRRLDCFGMYLSAAVFTVFAVNFRQDFGYAGSTWELRAFQGKLALVITDESRKFIYEEGWFWRENKNLLMDSILYAPFPTIKFAKTHTVLSMPVAAIALGVALLSFVVWRRARAFPIGICVKCSYNLKGNESGVCPECGSPIPACK